MANLLSWAKKKVQQVEQGAEHVWDQVNPLDNGRTYSNPQGNAPQQQGQAPPSAWRQATGQAGNAVRDVNQAANTVNPVKAFGSALDLSTHIPQLKPFQDAINQNLIQPDKHIIGSVINPGKVVTAALSGNKVAERNAINKSKADLGATGQLAQQFITRPAAEIGASLANKTFHPGNRLEKALLGDVPVKPVQEDVRGVYRAVKGGHQNLPGGIPISPKLAAPYAVAAGVLHGLNDVPIGGVAIKTGSKIAKDVSKGVKLAGDAKLPQPKPLNQEGKLKLPFGQNNQSFHYTSPDNSITKVSGKRDAVLAKLNEGGYVKVPGGAKDPNSPALPAPKPPEVPPTPVKAAASAAGKGTTKLASEYEIGQAIGMSRADIAKAKVQNPLEQAHPSLTAEELANLNPKEQMKIASAQQAPLNEPAVNTAKNPFKASIPQAKHNDFGQVISNEQVASEIGKDNVLRSMEVASKKSPAEFKNFWEYANNDPGFEKPKSPEMKQALDAWRTADNRIHGNSQALGGNTNYLENHGLHPTVFDKGLTSDLMSGTDPNKFSGLHNLTRKHPTMASLRAAAEKGGFSVGTDPLSEANHYLSASEHALRRRAIIKGVAEADAANLEKPHTLILGSGEKNRVDISQKAHNELRGLQRSIPTTNRVVKGARTANVGLKSTILSFGQFHPNNISLMRAAPTVAIPKPSTLIYRNKATGKLGVDLTMSAHPVKAAKGLYATYRPLAPGGKGYAARVNAKAVADGMDTKAARIGAPYNAQLFDSEGSSISGVGHKLLGRQMLGMHDQSVRAVISDLEKRGISLDSAEARTAGKAVNNMMGFINNEAQKIPPVVSRSMGDWLLARQFTHSKFSQVRTATTKGGVGGAYARANVAANVVASTAIGLGVGYILKQKSDSIRDALIRGLTDPAISTPMKDAKGNTVKLRLPGTDTSDIAHLLGIKPVRQKDGHLGISWKPSNMPGTVEDFLRARLAPGASAAIKVLTNENYAGKPLFDPSAKFGTKVEQAGTVIGSGLLPIGLQGLPQTKAIEKHLPGNIQDVLNASKPGGNPLTKSLGSSFGVTPTTDMTTGKALDASRYFQALDQAKKGLNGHEAAALELYAGNKKNPVTGNYDVQPNSNDTSAKARALLDQPKVIDKLIAMNKNLKDQGSKVDPLWAQSRDRVNKVLQYQAMPPGGPDREHWYNQNKDWYEGLSNDRTAFFNKLPKGDPNKPIAPIEFPKAAPDVAAKQSEFFNITDSGKRSNFLRDNPEVQAQLDKQVDYNNKMREAQGYSALDTFPKAEPGVQNIIDAYNKLPKNDGPKGGSKTRSLWIQAHPGEYAAMTKYFTQASLYGLEKDAAQAQFQDTGFSQKGLKDIANLGQHSIQTTKDANGNTLYALGGGGDSNSSGGSGYKNARSGSSGNSREPKFTVAKIKAKKLSAPKGIKVRQLSSRSTKPTRISVSKIPKIKLG